MPRPLLGRTRISLPICSFWLVYLHVFFEWFNKRNVSGGYVFCRWWFWLHGKYLCHRQFQMPWRHQSFHYRRWQRIIKSQRCHGDAIWYHQGTMPEDLSRWQRTFAICLQIVSLFERVKTLLVIWTQQLWQKFFLDNYWFLIVYL